MPHEFTIAALRNLCATSRAISAMRDRTVAGPLAALDAVIAPTTLSDFTSEIGRLPEIIT